MLTVRRRIACSLLLMAVFLLPACNSGSKPQEHILYHPDSKAVMRRYTTIDDKIDGLMTEYYPDGNIKIKRIFKDGIQVGRTEAFYPDGKLHEVQYYENGQKQGGDTIFYPNGRPQFLVSFKDGKKDGFLRKWDENGQLYFEARYQQDSLLEVTTLKGRE